MAFYMKRERRVSHHAAVSSAIKVATLNQTHLQETKTPLVSQLFLAMFVPSLSW
jgi:hypothetical protein